MKKFFGLFLAVVLACCVPGVSLAEVLTHPEAKIEITVPDTWKQSQDGNMLKVETADGEMAILFMVLEQAEKDKVLEAIDKSLEAKLGEIKWENDGNSKPEEINGMKGEIWNGTAKEGKFQVECISLDTPSDKNLGIYWFDTPESEKKYAKDIETIVKGLKPLAGAPAAPAAPAADDDKKE